MTDLIYPIGGETRINTTTAGQQAYVNFTALTNGYFVATWEGKGTQPGQEDDVGIFQQVYDAGGNRIGRETRVNSVVAPEEEIEDPTQHDPKIIALPGGRWATVWRENSDKYKLQVFDLNARIGSELQLNSGEINDVYGFHMVKLSSGGFVCVWNGSSAQVGQGDDSGIFFQAFNDRGEKVGMETRLNTSTVGTQKLLSVIELPDGFVAFWVGQGDQAGQEDDRGIFMQRFDKNWHAVGGEKRVNTAVAGRDEALTNKIALADGGWVVTYRSSDVAGNKEEWQQAFNHDGSLRGNEVRLTSVGPTVSPSTRLHALADGKWVTVWKEGATSDSAKMYMQVYGAGGVATSPKTLIATSPEGMQSIQAIHHRPDGGFVVFWSGNGTQPGHQDDDGLFFQRFDASGGKVGQETRVNTSIAGRQHSISIHDLPNGNHVAVWSSADYTGPARIDDVVQQVLDADFNPIGIETRMATSQVRLQYFDEVLVRPDGSWFVSWYGDGSLPGHEDPIDNGAGGGVFFRHFKLASAPTGITISGSIREDATGGMIAGTLTATDSDPNDTFTYMIVDDQGANTTHPLFEISGDKVRLKQGARLDYESAATHTLRVKVVDANGGTLIQNVTVAVSDAADIFTGTKTKDKIIGTLGNDTIYGKLGNDLLTGQSGQDIFVFDTRPNKKTNLDTITDFSVADDTLWLDNAVFKKLGKGSASKPGALKKAFFKVADKAKDANDYLVYNKKTGILSYDADGSGSGKALEIAKLSKNLKLTAGDFFVV